MATATEREQLRDNALTESSQCHLVSDFWQQWQQHQDQLYRCCLKLMNSNPTDAEDALSRAMVKAWEKVQRFQGKITNVKAWLIQLTRNLCIDMIRERSREATGVENIEWVGDTEEITTAFLVESPECALESEEKSTEIRRAIADLPERLRQTFICHFYQEHTHTEIAEIQGISYDNVCKRISLARKRLKQKLKGYFFRGESQVSATASVGKKSPGPREDGENQKKIEHDQNKALETGTESVDHECVEVVDSQTHQFVNSSVEPIANVGEKITITDVANVSSELPQSSRQPVLLPSLILDQTLTETVGAIATLLERLRETFIWYCDQEYSHQKIAQVQESKADFGYDSALLAPQFWAPPALLRSTSTEKDREKKSENSRKKRLIDEAEKT
ncbi:RNA polymerase sigma factor [Moorena sp. SIO3A2]|uniref:RNA polymerase sigma factor n=1 Tax=Moorena sp. SIO3A2 TaxID=2607841 RepID=UPI0013BDE0EA|nr:RNA polymerase sigma factor [Moorena sp. SIO3A2]NER87937.1 RNA polymerase sigma factor [Moorena sp. SIO3A2]